jgi:hypothetical protein
MHKEVLMTITVRLPGEVEKAIRDKAKKEGLSLNRTMAELLAQALGQGAGTGKKKLHHDLDKYAGLWSKEEADEIDEAIKEQRRIEPDMWK